MEIGERFWSKVDKSSDCWEWTAHTDGDGYGIFWVDGVNRRAHRISYAVTHGDPGDLMVCHSCDNPRCVNPAHLFLGDATANNRDRERKGRGAHGNAHWTRRRPGDVPRGDAWRDKFGERNGVRGEDVNTAKLTEDDVREIRRNVEGLTQPERARRYGVSKQTIQQAVSRRTWRHVE